MDSDDTSNPGSSDEDSSNPGSSDEDSSNPGFSNEELETDLTTEGITTKIDLVATKSCNKHLHVL